MRTRMTLCILGLLSFSCSGGGEGIGRVELPIEPPATQQGNFIDSHVEGIGYLSSTGEGLTGSQGEFLYQNGDTVTFSIGRIDLGETVGGGIVTPADLQTAPGTPLTSARIINVARFLQTLDADDDPSNGIQITDLMRNQALSHTLNFDQSADQFVDDGAVQIAVSDITAVRPIGPRSLAPLESSVSHYQDSLDVLIGELEMQLETLIGTAACDTSADCDAVAVSNRPCGGPGAYLPFSITQTSPEELEAVAVEHRRHSRSLHALLELVSICSVLPKPTLDCVAQQCVAQ